MIVTIGTFVGKTIASWAIGKGLTKLFTNEQTFATALERVVNKSITEYMEKYPITEKDGKFPFYESQIFLEELLKLRLFGDKRYELDTKIITKQLQQNKNIIPPSKQQLSKFLDIFEKYRQADEELNKLEIKENYQEQVFHNSDKLDSILEILENISSGHKSIPKQLTPLQRLKQDKIVGRETDLQKLRYSLLDNRETVLVNGMGGIGKTTLAAVYVDTFYEEYDYIAWLTLEESLAGSIAVNYSLLENLKLLEVPPQQQCAACLNALRTLDGEKPLLLILDNATANLWADFENLPKAPGCHLLVTSRERIEPFHIIELDFLPPEDAVKLFRQHNKLYTDDQVKEIITKVEYHTLTIELLAKSAQKFRWSFAEILTALPADSDADVAVFHSHNAKIARIKSYLTSIFKLHTRDDFELYLLKQFLFLPNEWIAYPFLEHLLQREKLPQERQKRFAGALENLYALGLLQKDEQQDSYKLHPVLAEALIPQLNIEWNDIELLCDSVTELLSLNQTQDNPIDKFQYIPFGESILKQAGDDFAVELSVLKHHLIIVYHEFGEYTFTRDLLELTLASDIINFGKKHPSVANRMNDLAGIYYSLGDNKKARELWEQALVICRDKLGAEHPYTISVIKSLQQINLKK